MNNLSASEFIERLVYLYSLPATKGNEAYQIWLLRNGQSISAGTFRVGDNGLGVLSVIVHKEDRLDGIGVIWSPMRMGSNRAGARYWEHNV